MQFSDAMEQQGGIGIRKTAGREKDRPVSERCVCLSLLGRVDDVP